MFRFGSVALRHVIKELRGTTYNEIEIKNRQKQKNTPQQRDCQTANSGLNAREASRGELLEH